MIHTPTVERQWGVFYIDFTYINDIILPEVHHTSNWRLYMATNPRPSRPKSTRPTSTVSASPPAASTASTGTAPGPTKTFWEKCKDNIKDHQGRLITGTIAVFIFLVIAFFSWPDAIGFLKPSWYVWLAAFGLALFILWPADEKTWTWLPVLAFVILFVSNVGSKAMRHGKEVAEKERVEQAAYLKLHPPLPPVPERDSVGFTATKGEFTRPWRVPSKYAGYQVAIWPSNLNVRTVVKTDVKTDTIRPDHDAKFGYSRVYAFKSPDEDQLIMVYLCKNRCTDP
ncbi:MAG: hypothetical protein V4465_02615 [Patescibacteria group bacterium]